MSMMNRLGNVKNPYQGRFRKVLTVCSAGLLRSPTAAWILGQEPFCYNTRAAGAVSEYALVPVDEALIYWANEIVFMEQEHRDAMPASFEEFLQSKDIVILAVPDKYRYRDPELVKMITKQYQDALMIRKATHG